MAASAAPARPTMLTVLGWIWIALGSFFTLTSALVAAMVLLVPDEFQPRDMDPPAESRFPGIIDWAFDHFQSLVVVQLVVAVIILVAAVYLLKQRAWARTLLEVVSWLGLTYVVLFTAWFGYFWLTSTAMEAPGPSADPSEPFFRAFGAAAAILTLLFYGGPLCVLIWLLRHPTVRGAVSARQLRNH